MEVKLLQATSRDIPFLRLLRRLTMNDYLQASGLATNRKSQLARINYHFEDAKLVYHNGKRIGLFKVYLCGAIWHVIQIQILPEYQGNGLGAKLLTNLIKQANEKQQSISLSVLKSNPAMNLYQKLGFMTISESDIELTMEYASNR